MIKKILLLILFITLAACDGGGSSSSEPDNGTGGNGGSNLPPTLEKGKNFVTFETGQVRPLAKSPDGTKLFALNTPNGSLEIFNITPTGLTLNSSVPVGMEPTAVAALSDSIVLVVNHLSDSISIVDVSGTPKVIQTLLVGDEPRDIIFAGAGDKFAFITTAHRGQNGQNDTTVYVAVFFSGNKTTILGEDNITKAAPVVDSNSTPQPDTGLIVQFKNNDWFDAENNSSANFSGVLTAYKDKIPFSLPDYDVFKIDASIAKPDAVLNNVANNRFSGVGTTLFNMVTNDNGTVYVSNTNALNLTRFEGTRNSNSSAISTIRGHFVESQITVIKNNIVTPVHLNDHIDYTKASGNQTERDAAISQPVDMAINGTTLYVAGFGSQNIVVYDTTKLDAGTNDQLQNPQIKLRVQ